MAHETLLKFGYPRSLVHEYEQWVVLVRPEQVTAGSLVLACKEQAIRFGDLSAATYAELGKAVQNLEAALSRAFEYDKINYLMLMMVDPHVHFHVFPRYASERAVCGLTLVDSGWPKAPDMTAPVRLGDEQIAELVQRVQSHWPTPSP